MIMTTLHDDTNFLDAYLTLGVEPGASWPEIKLSFRKKTFEWHPDREYNRQSQQTTQNNNLAKDNFIRLCQAYQQLKTYQKQHGKMPIEIKKSSTLKPSTPNINTQSPTNTQQKNKTKTYRYMKDIQTESRLLILEAKFLLRRLFRLIIKTKSIPKTINRQQRKKQLAHTSKTIKNDQNL
jgi:hypothetical protein